jgi:hypothetical protein
LRTWNYTYDAEGNLLAQEGAGGELITDGDYYLCTYINGEVQRNLGGANTTKFRGGQGIIGPGLLFPK